MTNRRAKVTPETMAEAQRLAELWATRPHPSQAEFGDTYAIGNQSAVGQFLRGQTPLSLKAARGFAKGLGCNIEDFSPRLAAEAADIASAIPGELPPEIAEVAQAVARLPDDQRAMFIAAMRNLLGMNDPVKQKGLSEAPTSEHVNARQRGAKRMRTG